MLRQQLHAALRRTVRVVYDQQRRCFASDESKPVAWVFLGPPGVGKGTYSTRVSAAYGMVHVAAGDLVRAEIRSGSQLGQQMSAIVNQGKLLPDTMILDAIRSTFSERGTQSGGARFLLDGFPRTALQAQELEGIADVQLALDMELREEVLVEKCLGRRICTHCGKNYNIADIYLPASDSRPEIKMPPLTPPPECQPHLEQRSDDKEETIRKRLEVYKSEARPVEEYYRAKGKLVDFEITGGIPETLPRLLEVLAPYHAQLGKAAA